MKIMIRYIPLPSVLIFLLFAVAVQAQPIPNGGGLVAPVTGTADNGTTFKGSFTINRFARSGDRILAVGILSGTLTHPGDEVEHVVQTTSLEVMTGTASNAQALIQQQQSCPILNLMLGPLDLDLLGLVIHLDKVTLIITAEAGPGNLLGNLLCAIANLLNQGGPLTQIVQLLNSILAALLQIG